jgi:hypothetical protein
MAALLAIGMAAPAEPIRATDIGGTAVRLAHAALAHDLSLHQRAAVPVEDHHFDLSHKRHRALYQPWRRTFLDPILTVSDAGIPCPSTLECVLSPIGFHSPQVWGELHPHKTGPPLA